MSRPLHIAYVSCEFPPFFGGGIGTYVDVISRALAEHGHRVTIITAAAGGSAPLDEQLPDGRRVLRLPAYDPRGRSPMDTLRIWRERGRSAAAALKGLHEQPDVIEFPDCRGEGVEYLSATAGRPRPLTVVRLHSPLSVLGRFNTGQPFYRALAEYEHAAIQATDRVVCPSRALVSELGAVWPGIPPVDISVHPVDPQFLKTEPGSELSSDVLFVGRLEELKGVETLAAAAATFLHRCPEAQLVFVGADTERCGLSERAIVTGNVPLALRSRLQFIEPRPRHELIELYRRARLCVFPAHYDTFPNTCLEAMALGKFVIGTYQTGMAEMIEDGRSGRLVPPRDVAALANCLIEAFQLPDEDLQRMGAAARRRVQEHFSAAVVAGDTAALYARYLSERPPNPVPCSLPIAPSPASSQDQFDELLAEAEIDYLRASRLWRLATRIGLSPSDAALAGIPSATQRLAAIQKSFSFRAIQSLKRSFVYRRYARRRYGPDALSPLQRID